MKNLQSTLKFPGIKRGDLDQKEKKKFSVIPYTHRLYHGLKKVASRFRVNVVFSARSKLSRVCTAVNTRASKEVPTSRTGCSVVHGMKFAPCVGSAVYKIPFSCGRSYIVQTDAPTRAAASCVCFRFNKISCLVSACLAFSRLSVFVQVALHFIMSDFNSPCRVFRRLRETKAAVGKGRAKSSLCELGVKDTPRCTQNRCFGSTIKVAVAQWRKQYVYFV